jgi:hypothetical protein
MHRHERTVRELLQKVLSDFDEPEKDLILFVIKKGYHVAFDEPASHRLSSIKEALYLALGNSAPPVLNKFETLTSEA